MAEDLCNLLHPSSSFGHMHSGGVPQDVWRDFRHSRARRCAAEPFLHRFDFLLAILDDEIGSRRP
jgi:hypothetical protein